MPRRPPRSSTEDEATTSTAVGLGITGKQSRSAELRCALCGEVTPLYWLTVEEILEAEPFKVYFHAECHPRSLDAYRRLDGTRLQRKLEALEKRSQDRRRSRDRFPLSPGRKEAIWKAAHASHAPPPPDPPVR